MGKHLATVKIIGSRSLTYWMITCHLCGVSTFPETRFVRLHQASNYARRHLFHHHGIQRSKRPNRSWAKADSYVRETKFSLGPGRDRLARLDVTHHKTAMKAKEQR